MDNKIFEMIRAVPPIEILFVFLPYYIRPLWPTTRIRTALENAKNKSDKNRLFQWHGRYGFGSCLGFEFDNQSFFSKDGTWWNHVFFCFFWDPIPWCFHTEIYIRILLSRLHIHCESVLFLCEALHRLLFELHPLSRAHHPWRPETRTCLALPCLIFAAFASSIMQKFQ